jgi:hypothetical protein
MATLPPPADAPADAPPAVLPPPYAVLVLATGIAVRLRRPTLYAMLATVGSVPSQLMIDVLNLLEEDGTIFDLLPPEVKFLRIRNKFRGMYALASALIESPRLVLAPETPNREAGEIGEEDISLTEVEWIYHSYFRARRFTPSGPPPPPAQPDGAAQPPPPGGDVPPPAA